MCNIRGHLSLVCVGLFVIICVLCTPVMLVKTGISLVHLYAASQNIVAIDMAEREAARHGAGAGKTD